MRFDVLALGDCGIDLYAKVERFPGHDDKVPGEFLGAYGGGVAANFSCAASRLGLSTGLLSTVGEDDFGRQAIDSLHAFGVDTEGVVAKPGAPTHFCFVALDDVGEKALTIVRTARFFPGWADVRTDLIESARLLHVAPFDVEVAQQAALHAVAADIPVSVDLEPGMLQGGVDTVVPLVQLCTLLLPNQACMDVLFGPDGHERGAERLLELGPEAVVISRGASGAYVCTRDETFAVPAYEVAVRDTTGAGDCFNAALVASWLAGRPLREAARFANAAGALSITEVGARSKLPTAAEIEEFMQRDVPSGRPA